MEGEGAGGIDPVSGRSHDGSRRDRAHGGWPRAPALRVAGSKVGGARGWGRGDRSGAPSSPRRQSQTPHDVGHLRWVLRFVHEPSAFFPHFLRHLYRFHGFFRTFFAHLLILRRHARFSSHARTVCVVFPWVWHSEYPESQCGSG